MTKEDKSPKESDHGYVNTVEQDYTEISVKKPDPMSKKPPSYEHLNVKQGDASHQHMYQCRNMEPPRTGD